MSSEFTGPKNGIWQPHEAGRCLQFLLQRCVLFQCVPILPPISILGNLPQGSAKTKGPEDASQELKFNLIKGTQYRVGYQVLWTRKSLASPSSQGSKSQKAAAQLPLLEAFSAGVPGCSTRDGAPAELYCNAWHKPQPGTCFRAS